VENWGTPAAYTGAKLIHRGHGACVYVATQRQDQTRVVLKSFAANDRGREFAKQEFAALRACVNPAIPRALDLDLRVEHPCLVLECVPGVPLRSFVESNGPLPIARLLELAITWAQALASIHAARIVHRDITPNNLMLDVASGAAYVIDFGIATPLAGAAGSWTTDAGGSRLAGTLEYIAPEQTGRMNRAYEFRSDLYGLGGSIYFALTGRPPFRFEAPLELIHAHIARTPQAPSTLRDEIPDPLSRLILKLLAKEPDERYTSAVSLLGDLTALHEQWTADGAMDPGFELEAIEVPDRIRFSSRLYGRDAEAEHLSARFEQCRTGQPGLVVLRGESGIGKSALVETLRAHVAECGGYLVRASCVQGEDRAYTGWSQCLESLAQQILVESNERLLAWRERLRAGLGNLAGVLVEHSADLGIVLGDVAPAVSVGVREGRARLLLAIQRLLAAAGTPEHPLVLFLDDFQNSDSGTREIAGELFASRLGGAFLLIVASNEADQPEVPCVIGAFTRRLDALDVPFELLGLGPVGEEGLLDLLEDAMRKPRSELRPLVADLQRKTGGNPLWVRQLLEHLQRERLLRYDLRDAWTWDMTSIAGAEIPEGAVGLLIAKLESLDPELHETMSWASCAGNSIDPELLAAFMGVGPDEVRERLVRLEAIGLVVPRTQGFRFAHDRVREAVHDQLPAPERCERHANAARCLLQANRSSRAGAVEIATHIVLAGSAWPRNERQSRLECCLAAGKEALRSGAIDEASRYLEAARAEFDASDWSQQRELGLKLWLKSAECAQLSADSEAALALLDQIQPHARSHLERGQLEMQRLQAMALTRPAPECVRHALEMLRKLGVRWVAHPSHLRIYWAMMRVWRSVFARSKQGIDAPGGSLDPRRVAALQIINAAGGAMARTDRRLAALATCFVLEAPLPAGFNVREAYSVGNFALWVQVILGRPQSAVSLASAARNWLAQCGDPIYLTRFEITMYGSLDPCVTRRRQGLPGLADAADRMQELGDLEFAYYARFLHAYLGAMAGNPVAASHREFADLGDLVQRRRLRFAEPLRCRDVYAALIEPSEPPGDSLASSSAGPLQSDARDASDVWSVTLKTLILCVFGRFEELWQESEALGVRVFRETPYAYFPQHLLYRGIAAAALMSSGPRTKLHARALRQAIRLVGQWSNYGPDFAHMEELLRAEHARVRGRVEEAHRRYEKAARGALSQDFPHHAAIAKERRALLLIQLRRDTEGIRILQQAQGLYEAWGAVTKVELLKSYLREAEHV